MPSSTPAHLAASAPDPPRATSRGLKVLDVTNFYTDTGTGGVKTYLHAKSVGLAALGIDHVMVTAGASTSVGRTLESRHHRIESPVLSLSPAYRVLRSTDELARVLARERPDVVEVGSPFVLPGMVRRALAGRPTPTVGFYHADLVRTYAEPYLTHPVAAPLRAVARTAARRWARRVYRRFDATVASSISVVEELRSWGIPCEDPVGMGVDLRTFRPLPPEERADRTAWGVDPGVPVGVFAGRFCAEKRLDVVLDGHARIPADARPHLVLVGGGPHLERLQERVRHRPRLTLLPYVKDREALARLYASAGFYLAAGPGETFGLSIAEAMACGLAVVGVDRGAGPDRFRGSRVGETYRHGDADSAGAALARMGARLTREDPEALRRRARRHAEEHFDWTRTFARLATLYERLAAARRR